MNVKIYPGRLLGKINAKPSKSYAQRYIFASLFCKEETEILFNGGCADIDSALSVAESLGANVKRTERGVIITPPETFHRHPLLNVGESFTALNLIIPALSALGIEAEIRGEGTANARKIFFDDLLDGNALPVKITKKLSGGKIEIDGDKTSQAVSGLMFALPFLPDDSEIILKTPLVSGPYVDITKDALKSFGIEIVETETGYKIKGDKRYVSPERIAVEGDYTSSAVFFTANVIGNIIKVNGLNPNSVQGDAVFNKLALGFKSSGTVTDVTDTPDLFPYLAVVAGYSSSKTTFTGTGRLKNKESDRVSSVYECLSSLGVKCEKGDDTFTVYGNGKVKGGEISSFGDHRIVTAFAVAGTMTSEPVIIKNCECVKKSYPDFFEDFKSLGGKYEIC